MTEGAIAKSSEVLAVSQTLSMLRSFTHGNREIQEMSERDELSDRVVKGKTRTTTMHVSWKSDEAVVPLIRRRPAGRGSGEERAETLENSNWPPMSEAQDSESIEDGLERICKAAKRDRGMRLTSLLHHVSVSALEGAYMSLKRSASPGIDDVTWAEYGENLQIRLIDLHERLHGGRYRGQPSKRAWIPKSDGTKRPIGIAALEDKIVQFSVGRILQAIYEPDFTDFSYGFRPGLGQHNALDAVWLGLTQKKVNWIVDADIKSFFDTLDHGWVMKFLEHRVADSRLLRIVQQWLRAGVSESGNWSATSIGTPQGAVISPLLANVYLHYVLDLWLSWWRKSECKGEVMMVRYADDCAPRRRERTDYVQLSSDMLCVR